eukprot:jgi/Botrbrau1/10186/Bobra.116_1s0003.1
MGGAVACQGVSSVAQPHRPRRVRTLRHPHDMQRHFQPFLRQHLKNIQKFRQSLRLTEREFEPPDVPHDSEEQFSPFRYISDSKPSVWSLSQWTELLQQKTSPQVDYFSRYEGIPDELEGEPTKSSGWSTSRSHLQDFRLR